MDCLNIFATSCSKPTGSSSLNWFIIYQGTMKMRWWIYLSHIFELWDEEIDYAEKIITVLLNTQLMQFCKESLRKFTVFISTSHSSNIWNCRFCNFEIFAITLRSSLRRGKNRSTQRKTSWSKRENQQQTQPTYVIDTRIQTQATLVGGKCSGFSIEGGTRRLIAAYFGIYSRLLCV